MFSGSRHRFAVRDDGFWPTVAAVLVGISIFILPIAAAAHHSFNAVFDEDRVIELEGEVTDVLWRNPHVRLKMRVGDGEIWDIETDSVSILTRKEIPADILAEGDRVRLAGNPARERDNEMYAHHALLPDGREVVFSPNRPPRWTSQVVGTTETWTAPEGDGSRPDLGLFRVWSTSLADPVLSQPLFPEDLQPELAHDYPLTDTARDALSRFDPETDTPTQGCAPKGMPTIIETPYPQEFVDKGDRILHRIEEYDTTRVIHMADAPSAEAVEPSLLGHSVGHWEGDTLVVKTTQVNWGHFDTVGIPLSEDAEITEWFTTAEDGSRLDYRLRVIDPATFTEPVELDRAWIYLPEAEVKPYECVS